MPAPDASIPPTLLGSPILASDVDRFAAACGALAPVHLRIDRADGVLLTEGVLDLPCGMIGSAPDAEVTLTAPEVSPRHAALQVVGGRVLVADLGSQTGVAGVNGGGPFAWLGVGAPVSIGPFQLSLRGLVADLPETNINPLAPDPVVDRLPRAAVRFLSGRSPRPEWMVNRLVTFVGRAPGCKIALASDDVAAYHCYLVLTPAGLWVVDLLAPGGVAVNGDPVRFARLAEGDVVQVGRFRLGSHYPGGDQTRRRVP